MTSDPWTLHASLACPSCHVVGKVISQENTDDEWPCGDDYCCVDCGSTWFDGGALSDEMLKERRIQFGRLIEGRPYEPPKPQFEPIKTTPAWADAMDKLLRDYYNPATLGSAMGIPADLLAKPAIPFHRSNAAWSFQSAYDRQRSKVLPTGDVVTDLGGSATIQFKDNSDPPWTSWLFDTDAGTRSIVINYRTKRYHWNLATDEVTEK